MKNNLPLSETGTDPLCKHTVNFISWLGNLLIHGTEEKEED